MLRTHSLWLILVSSSAAPFLSQVARRRIPDYRRKGCGFKYKRLVKMPRAVCPINKAFGSKCVIWITENTKRRTDDPDSYSPYERRGSLREPGPTRQLLSPTHQLTETADTERGRPMTTTKGDQIPGSSPRLCGTSRRTLQRRREDPLWLTLRRVHCRPARAHASLASTIPAATDRVEY